MTQELKLLRMARELIATPEQWAQGAAALNAKGEVVSVLDSSAVRFCALGAVAVAARSLGIPEDDGTKMEVRNRLADASGHLSISAFNDSSDHGKVLAAFDAAIAGAAK